MGEQISTFQINAGTEQEPVVRRHPVLIQGGMGAGVSNFEVARAVAKAGEKLDQETLGVVSGTGLPHIMISRLRKGDQQTQGALYAFNPEIADEIYTEYVVRHPTKILPTPEVLVNGSDRLREKMTKLAVASAFVEVYLAKQGHNQPIGINMLEKIQPMILPTLLGAMLAGADYVIAGAGSPAQFKKVIDDLAHGRVAEYKMYIEGLKNGKREDHMLTLDTTPYLPKKENDPERQVLKKPYFFAVLSSHIFIERFADKIDGVIVEGFVAGGHNSPPRDKKRVDDLGQPVYGDRDIPDFKRIKDVCAQYEIPFYLAGGWEGRLHEAQEEYNATGIQIGSPIAITEESGFTKNIKQQLRTHIVNGTLDVRTSGIDALSPTDYPFKWVQHIKGTIAETAEEFSRRCNKGYLRHYYWKENGTIGSRCPADQIDIYVASVAAGEKDDVAEREIRVARALLAKCLCRELLTAIGYGDNGDPAIVTFGDIWQPIQEYFKDEEGKFVPGIKITVEDVIRRNTVTRMISYTD